MFIFDGNPNGRIMCELSNWNGRVYKISRNELPEFSQRDDSENTGVYFLFGKNEENMNVCISPKIHFWGNTMSRHFPFSFIKAKLFILFISAFPLHF